MSSPQYVPRPKDRAQRDGAYAPFPVIGEVLTAEGAPWGQVLICPVCGPADQLDVGRCVHVAGSPVAAAGLDATGASAWDGRGDVVAVPLYCENGHAWTLCLGFHKGSLHLYSSRALPGSRGFEGR